MPKKATQVRKDEEIEYLKKQLAEYEAVETYIMKMLKKKCDYEDVLKAHYREGKVVNGEWVDDDECECQNMEIINEFVFDENLVYYIYVI